MEEEVLTEPIIEDIKIVKEPTKRSKVNLDAWKPKTDLGRKVKNKEINNIDEILDRGYRILEAEIVDTLLPNIEIEIASVGQSKGKFGGGKRTLWKQTQKKTKEGNKSKFSAVVIVGNRDGYVGVGRGKAKETMPAKEKALRQAKLNIIKIKRGCGSWVCNCREPHSIPFTVEGKCGNSKMKIIPAPKGTSLCMERESKKIIQLAGIKDVYANSKGSSKINTIYACFDALKKLSKTKYTTEFAEKAGLVEGKLIEK